jgi:hypothetical protein
MVRRVCLHSYLGSIKLSVSMKEEILRFSTLKIPLENCMLATMSERSSEEYILND